MWYDMYVIIYCLSFLNAFLWLTGDQEVIFCLNMNIFWLGGDQEPIICAIIEVNIQTKVSPVGGIDFM